MSGNKQDMGASAVPSGSRASHEAATHLHPPGIDPSRGWQNFITAMRLLLGVSKCVVFGHANSGEFYCSQRCWQRCARCGGWLGWMFHWEKPWTHQNAIDAIAMEARQRTDPEGLDPKGNSAGRRHRHNDIG